MKIDDIQAIDVHGHYGNYTHGSYTDETNNEKYQLIDHFMTANAEEVIRRAKVCNTEQTVVSPLKALFSKSAEDVISANQHAAEVAQKYRELLQWVVIHPLYPETYHQADEMLQMPQCVGIKIHPETHRYPIKQHGEKIFELAARHKTVIKAHSGEQNSLPNDFIFFADRFPEMSLILAHLGLGWDGDYSLQVRAIQASKAGNIYTDTSSARSITPNLIEWAVSEIGADRILYGTDTPLYLSAMQRARINYAEIENKEKLLILRENAIQLLKLQ
jgi:predicted TIM-barrel fold metal-dependent hydrolase